MAELQHFAHGCALTSPKSVQDSIGVCNICYKDEPVEFACRSCNFDLCKPCSNLPEKVSHDFHPEHPLEFCLAQYDRRPEYVVCSGCGNMCFGSLYECKKCEIYLDLGCALLGNIVKGWDLKEMLHYSHAHLVKRCRPGPDARGSCLLCELPLSPSAICYGCVHCYSFFHERCVDLPIEIQHPVHPTHPLRRLDYIQTCGDGKICNACKLHIDGAPFGCLECDFNLHMRCADSLLRGLMHKSHEHRLFYVSASDGNGFGEDSPCQICKGTDMISLESFYHCLECQLKFHFECLEIPESVFKKSYHNHPLVCKLYIPNKEDSLEYCGVCETMINSGHHTYSCQECDFLGHIECILRKEEPSPLYLKHLYSCSKSITKPAEQEDRVTNKSENELMVNGIKHIHVMISIRMNELGEQKDCNICDEKITGILFKCKTCRFYTHDICAELGQASRHGFHLNHPLTLLPCRPVHDMMECDICKKNIYGFNLFCRICNFIIDMECALKGKHSLGTLGHKVIRTLNSHCMSKKHSLVQVIVSRSYPTCCAICDESLCGRAMSCMICREMYHPQCFEVEREIDIGHPLHPNHSLEISFVSGSNCTACKLNIEKYGYHCSTCEVDFHINCIKAVSISGNIGSHKHYLYNFWSADSQLTRACSVCARPCGASFYSCIDCKFNAHAECIGFPMNVKNQRHQHTVTEREIMIMKKTCSLCGSECSGDLYYCYLCMVFFHKECIMSTEDHDAATEEQQIRDIYLMYIERDLLNNFTEENGQDLLELNMLEDFGNAFNDLIAKFTF